MFAASSDDPPTDGHWTDNNLRAVLAGYADFCSLSGGFRVTRTRRHDDPIRPRSA